VSADDAAPSFRHPVEADHVALEPLLDDWFGGRRVRRFLPRLWFRHFASTSWVAEATDGRLVGFLVGFVSGDRPDEAVVLLAATSPNRRHRGIGRALVDRFEAEVALRGARRLVAWTWPDERPAVEFLQAIGFTSLEGPGTVRLYGVPAVPDFEGEGEDRAVFTREVAPRP
jgi:ribosomal protein S18 acetylase RimI-like enzyme